MLLKIKVKSEVLRVCLSLILVPFMAFICILIVGLINNKTNLIELSMLFMILSVVFSIALLQRLQWFLVFEDRIIVKNIFGVVNKVRFSDVKYIEEKNLPLFTKDNGVAHYIFVDGRPEKKIGISQQSNTVNFKKTSVRIYVTPDLTDIVENQGFCIFRNRN